MLVKMQSRPTQYPAPSTLQTLQRSSYTNGYSDYLSYGTYPSSLTPSLYPSPAYTSNNNASSSATTSAAAAAASSTYLYYGAGQPTTNTLLGEPNSPNNSVSSPVSVNSPNPQSPTCVFSPSGNSSENLNSSSTSPPLNYDSAVSDMLYTKYPATYHSVPPQQYTTATPPSTSSSYSVPCTAYSNDISHSLTGNGGSNSSAGYSVYPNGYSSSAGTGYNHCLPSSSSTLYPDHLNSTYSASAPVNISGSSGSSFALWNYPSLQVGKVSYDTPRFKLTPERAIPLIKWFEEHKDHPYPSRHEKMMLCQSTQLTFTQVSTWFANARRRMKKAAHEEEEEEEDSASDEEKLK